ncbi:hypothetical protein RJ55_01965 [Drechmeria coniospora]|nr:hypothetical protein RJ55_01965 [Drechmeria coniospora]
MQPLAPSPVTAAPVVARDRGRKGPACLLALPCLPPACAGPRSSEARPPPPALLLPLPCPPPASPVSPRRLVIQSTPSQPCPGAIHTNLASAAPAFPPRPCQSSLPRFPAHLLLRSPPSPPRPSIRASRALEPPSLGAFSSLHPLGSLLRRRRPPPFLPAPVGPPPSAASSSEPRPRPGATRPSPEPRVPLSLDLALALAPRDLGRTTGLAPIRRRRPIVPRPDDLGVGRFVCLVEEDAPQSPALDPSTPWIWIMR